jgi:Ser-tRNA(Ala) deacylase AlaX
MNSLPAYEREPYRTEIDAVVLSAGVDQGRPYAVLSDTVLYPEGGGQPADRGFLDQIEVLDVRKAGEGIRHYLAAAVGTGPVKVRLDWARRFDHMQQHTGQHVLTAVAQERFGWETTAFHLGEERCDIELAVPSLSSEELARLEDAVAAMIRSARPVQPRRVSLDAYGTMQVRSRGLPEGHSGEVRLVEISGVAVTT